MPLTNAEKQKRARDKRSEKLARYEAALKAIAGGCTMPSETARQAFSPDAMQSKEDK